MKSCFSVVALAITAASFAYAENQPEPKDATKLIVAGQAAHDFGVAKGGVVVSHTFKLVNPLNVPILIVSVQTTSGAGSAIIDKKFLKPGESAELQLRVDTKRFTGPKTLRAVAMIEGRGLPLQKAEVSLSVNSRP